MAYKMGRQLELLTGVYREMRHRESHTKDPVIREVVCDGNNNYSCVLESLEEALKDGVPSAVPRSGIGERG